MALDSIHAIFYTYHIGIAFLPFQCPVGSTPGHFQKEHCFSRWWSLPDCCSAWCWHSHNPAPACWTPKQDSVPTANSRHDQRLPEYWCNYPYPVDCVRGRILRHDPVRALQFVAWHIVDQEKHPVVVWRRTDGQRKTNNYIEGEDSIVTNNFPATLYYTNFVWEYYTSQECHDAN